MGDNAFETARDGHQDLYCPPVPRTVYEAVRGEIVKALKVGFVFVVVPHEHPETTEFREVALLVCKPIAPFEKLRTMKDLEGTIANLLEAKRSRINDNGVGHFTCKVPEEIAGIDTVAQTKGENQLGSAKEYWIRVEVEFVDSPSQLNWCIFEKAHSTFFNILRLGLRPSGLVFKRNGLYIKLWNDPESEPGEPPCPMIYLSNNVTEVLKFLELDPNRHKRPFETQIKYWVYATSAKYFSRELFGIPHQSGRDDDVRSNHSSGSSTYMSDTCKPEHKGLGRFLEYLGRHEPWKKFVGEWLPGHSGIGLVTHDREQVFLTVMAYFKRRSPHFSPYIMWTEEHADFKFWAEVSEFLYASTEPPPTQRYVNEVIIAAKRWVVFTSVHGKAKIPTIRGGPAEEDVKHAEWLDVVKNNKWIASSREGGFLPRELRDWVLLLATELREMERARTRGGRREADARRLERKLQAAMRVTVMGRLLCGTTGALKNGFLYLIGAVDKVENWWKGQQRVYAWKPNPPTNGM